MRVAWTRNALAHLDQIQDHVALESPAAAYRLVNDVIDRTEALLLGNPNAGKRGRVAGTREFVLAGTSYIIVYRLRHDVEIVAVVHAARDWPAEFS